jgi:hypothetical protein
MNEETRITPKAREVKGSNEELQAPPEIEKCVTVVGCKLMVKIQTLTHLP